MSAPENSVRYIPLFPQDALLGSANPEEKLFPNETTWYGKTVDFIKFEARGAAECLKLGLTAGAIFAVINGVSYCYNSFADPEFVDHPSKYLSYDYALTLGAFHLASFGISQLVMPIYRNYLGNIKSEPKKFLATVLSGTTTSYLAGMALSTIFNMRVGNPEFIASVLAYTQFTAVSVAKQKIKEIDEEKEKNKLLAAASSTPENVAS